MVSAADAVQAGPLGTHAPVPLDPLLQEARLSVLDNLPLPDPSVPVLPPGVDAEGAAPGNHLEVFLARQAPAQRNDARGMTDQNDAFRVRVLGLGAGNEGGKESARAGEEARKGLAATGGVQSRSVGRFEEGGREKLGEVRGAAGTGVQVPRIRVGRRRVLAGKQVSTRASVG